MFQPQATSIIFHMRLELVQSILHIIGYTDCSIATLALCRIVFVSVRVKLFPDEGMHLSDKNACKCVRITKQDLV